MINWKEATNIFLKKYSLEKRNGKSVPIQKKLPYANFPHENFVLADIPLSSIKAYSTSEYLIEQCIKYIKNSNIDPVWLSFGRYYKDKDFVPFWDRKFQVKDGHHRVIAHKRMSCDRIMAYIPETHYIAWRNHYENN